MVDCVSLDVFAMLNGLLAREFGMFEGVDPDAPPAEATDDGARGVRSPTPNATGGGGAARAGGGAGKEAPALFVDRLRSWLRRAVVRPARPTGRPIAERAPLLVRVLDAAQFTAPAASPAGWGWRN